MEENTQEEIKKPRSNKPFILTAIALVILLLIISVVEIISINSLNDKIKDQQTEMDRLTNELNYYKDRANNNNDEYYDGTNGENLW